MTGRPTETRARRLDRRVTLVLEDRTIVGAGARVADRSGEAVEIELDLVQRELRAAVDDPGAEVQADADDVVARVARRDGLREVHARDVLELNDAVAGVESCRRSGQQHAGEKGQHSGNRRK